MFRVKHSGEVLARFLEFGHAESWALQLSLQSDELVSVVEPGSRGKGRALAQFRRGVPQPPPFTAPI